MKCPENVPLASQRQEADSDKRAWHERSFHAYDTACFIKAPVGEHVMDKIVALCRRYENLFSHTIPESDVGRINAAHGTRVSVDHETATLVKAALGYCKASGGLFDITMAPLASLWNYHAGSVPKTSDIERAREHVRWECVDVVGDTVVVADPQAEITLGGIAKGYIADRIRDLLAENGARDAFISLGGNVVVSGRGPSGNAWRIGVRSPAFHLDRKREHVENLARARSPHGVDPRALADAGRRREKPAFVLRASDLSIVTSGIYERCFRDKKTGGAYHHIVDPATGFPCESDLASATVISRRSIDGDGLSTALVIMGAKRAARFIEREFPGVAVLFITREGSTLVTGSKTLLRETGADVLPRT